MKLLANKKLLGQQPEMWLRSAGYMFIPEREAGQASFARRLSGDFYPRFHIYFTEAKASSGDDYVTFNLHLDQKRPGYAGQNDGEVVEREMERLKSLLLPDFLI